MVFTSFFGSLYSMVAYDLFIIILLMNKLFYYSQNIQSKSFRQKKKKLRTAAMRPTTVVVHVLTIFGWFTICDGMPKNQNAKGFENKKKVPMSITPTVPKKSVGSILTRGPGLHLNTLVLMENETYPPLHPTPSTSSDWHHQNSQDQLASSSASSSTTFQPPKSMSNAFDPLAQLNSSDPFQQFTNIPQSSSSSTTFQPPRSMSNTFDPLAQLNSSDPFQQFTNIPQSSWSDTTTSSNNGVVATEQSSWFSQGTADNSANDEMLQSIFNNKKSDRSKH